MKKMLKTLAFVAVAAIAGTAYAQNASWIGESYLIAAPNDETLTWFKASGGGDANNFDGYDFGEVSSLKLAGQAKTSQSDAEHYPAQIGYQFDGDDTTVVYTDLAWIGWNGNNNVFGYEPGDISGWSYPNPNYPGADSQVLDIDLSGLAPGEHTINVWFRAPNGDNWAWDSNNQQNYNATFTIPALVQTVTFDPSPYGTFRGEPTMTMTFDFGGTYHDLPNTTPDGTHARIGWFRVPDGQDGEPVVDGADVTGPAVLTLYAHWTDKQTLTFDPQNGEATWTGVFTVGSTYGTLPKPTWAGHAFVGWFTEAGKKLSNTSKVTTRPERTIYGQWSTEQTVVFDAQGGDCDPATMTAEMGGRYGPLPKPTKAGHAFVGWYTQAEGGSHLTANSIVTTLKTRTFYAHWTDGQTVTFDPQGGECDPLTMVATVGQPYGELPKPTKDNNTFRGWYTKAEGGSKVTAAATVTAAKTRALYAHWKLKGSKPAITGFSMAFRSATRATRGTSTVTDTLKASEFAATSTQYKDFSSVTFTSDAVYAGNSAKTSSGGIQLRTNNKNSGIVTTSSGGTAAKVSLVWEGTGSQVLDIYGKTSAYNAASDLYADSASTQGTFLGSITNGGTYTALEIGEQNCTHIGLRSHNGALYLTSIAIDWTVTTQDPTEPTVTLQATSTNVYVGTEVTVTGEAQNFNDTVSWAWKLNGTDSTQTGDTFTFTPSEAIDYTVKATATDGTLSATNEVTIKANEVPVAHAIAISTNGNGTAVADVATAYQGTTVNLTVEPGEGFVLGGITLNGETVTGTSFEMPNENANVVVTFVEIPDMYFRFEDNDVPASYSATNATFVNSGATAGTIPSVVFSVARIYKGDQVNDRKVGDVSIRMAPTSTDQSFVANAVAFGNAISKISFQYAKYGNDTLDSFTVQVSSDGETWSDLTAPETPTTSLQTYVNASIPDGMKFIRFLATSTVTGNTRRFNIDEIQIWFSEETTEYVAEIDGGAKYPSLRAAIEAASDEDTITLLADDAVSFAGITVVDGIPSDGSIVIDKDLMIDGGGYKVIGPSNADILNATGSATPGYDYAADLVDGSNLIGIFVKSGDVYFSNIGFTEFGDTAYVNKFGYTPIQTASAYDGALYVEDSVFGKFNRTAICIRGGTFSISDSTFTVDAENRDVAQGKDNFQQPIEIRGGSGTIADVIVDGEDYPYDTNAGGAIVAWSDVTISDVMIVDFPGIGIWADTPAVTVEGDGTGIIATDKALFAEEGGSITVAAGDFTGELAVDDGQGSSIVVNGGTFDRQVPAAFAGDGLAPTTIPDGNGKYTVDIACTVTFVTDKGVAPDAQAVAFGETATEPDPAPECEGWAFNYWTLNNAEYDFATPVEDDIELVANWTPTVQTVTFDPSPYGSFRGEPTMQMTFDIDGKYHDLPNTTPDGTHARIGWYTMPDGQGGDPVVDGDDVTVEATRTLYAHWTDKQTLTFDPQNGEATWTGVFTVGSTYGTLPKPTWAGHAFVGWFTEAGKKLSNTSKVTTRQERTIYAQWSTEQTVVFDAQGGDCDPATMTVEMGGRYGPLPKPTKAGYAFVGWYTQAEGGSHLTANSIVTTLKTRTFYAHWTAEQTVTFNPQGGTCDPLTMVATIGETYGELPVPTQAGYTFRGWYTKAEGGSKVTAAATVTAAKTRALYAHWKLKGSKPAITGFSVSPRATTGATRSAEASVLECTLVVETSADYVYEIQWTPSLLEDWTVLKHWTAEDDGESPVTFEVPAGYSSGFFRVIEFDEE